MKILHTADWHLGKRLEHIYRLEEQVQVLEEITRIADHHEVHAIIIAGDLFDSFNPPTEAIDLFYKTLKRLSNGGMRPVIAIAGNHDSPDRIEAPDPLARSCGILFSGYPDTIIPAFELDSGLCLRKTDKGFIELSIPGLSYPLRIIHTPYANEVRLKTFLGEDNSEAEMRRILEQKWHALSEKYCDDLGVNILTTHLFMIGKEGDDLSEPDDERPILHVGGAQVIFTEQIPSRIQYTALGHLHRFIKMERNGNPVIYSSSPLSYSFSEAEQQKYVVIVDVLPGEKAEIIPVPLQSGRPLLRRKFESVIECVSWLKANPYCWVELTVKTSEFISGAERKEIYQSHDGVIALIPELSQSNDIDNTHSINLSDDIDQLFKQYFEHKFKLAPDEAMMQLFQEIKSTDDTY
jgi:exonuclease SbcD